MSVNLSPASLSHLSYSLPSVKVRDNPLFEFKMFGSEETCYVFDRKKTTLDGYIKLGEGNAEYTGIQDLKRKIETGRIKPVKDKNRQFRIYIDLVEFQAK